MDALGEAIRRFSHEIPQKQIPVGFAFNAIPQEGDMLLRQHEPLRMRHQTQYLPGRIGYGGNIILGTVGVAGVIWRTAVRL